MSFHFPLFEENDHIVLNENNIYEYLGIKKRNFFFKTICKSVSAINTAKRYFSDKLYQFTNTLEHFRPKATNETIENAEKKLQELWNKESEEFIFATRRMIRQYTHRDLFILQIGLNNITSLIFDKPNNITFIEENAEVCKNFFLKKLNRCFFYWKGVEIHCTKGKDSLKIYDNSIDGIVNLIKKIYKNKKSHLIDILILNHKYATALLYYLFPYMDPSTLVVVINQMNYKMKKAVFTYYDFLGEISFSKNLDISMFYKNKENKETEEEEEEIKKENALNEKMPNEKKLKLPSLHITTLKPKMLINPPENDYKIYISNEYIVITETEMSLIINNLRNVLKSYRNLYKRNEVELLYYFNFLYDFDMHIDNGKMKKEIISSLSTAVAQSKKKNINEEEFFNSVLLNLKNFFKQMLFHVYEEAEFKTYFMPFIDFLSFYLKKQDVGYIIYQFLLYQLINESYGVSSYELKEYLYLDILRESSKKIKNLSDNEAILLLTKLIVILKKIKARDNISYIKSLAKELDVNYQDYEL